MLYQKTTLLILCMILLTLCLTAQQKSINFTSLTTEDGLSSNTVNAILKDRYGMVWFATEDGLDRFDGTRFTVYRHRPDDSSSLQANEILSLHEDKAGNLWIGTSGGSLNLYNRKTDSFIRFPSGGGTPNAIHNNVIRSICSDYAGNIWIGHFDGVNILDPITKKITEIPVATGHPAYAFNSTSKCLFEDSFNNMWIGTAKGLFQYNPANKSMLLFLHSDKDSGSVSGDKITDITQDKAGNVWVGTEKGLSMLRPGSNQFVNFRHTDLNPHTLSSSFINSVAVDGDKLWIGTSEGLNIMDTKTGEITKFTPDHRNMHSLSAAAVRCVYIDKQGIYWLGTIRGGVNKYDKNLNLFNHVRSNVFDEKGLNASIVTSFAENENGKVFIGTDGRGLSLFDPASRLFRHLSILSLRNLPGNRLPILALKMTRKKQLLIGTSGDGLFIFDPVSFTYQQLMQGAVAEELNADEVYSITELRNGNIMLGTNGAGIILLNSNFKVIARYTPLPRLENDILLPFNGYIRDVKEDKDGNIWIATHGGGLGILQSASHVFTNFNTQNSKLPNDKVNCLLEDTHGFMWAGTFGGGIARINIPSKQFEVFSEKEGLQNSNVCKIVEDQAALIWVSTNKGISSIDAASKKINNFNYHNGLQHNNFVRGSGMRLSDGQLLFGGLDGFNYFHPAYLIKNNNIPPVLLTGLRISNQYIHASNAGPITEHISIAKEINLDYKQNFALDFVGLSYTSPEQNRYAYKLEGFDKDWNYVGNMTSAPYTNLDPGDYVFRVRASNNDGVWNNVGSSVKVHVHPPIWRTTYAYAVYLLLLIAVLVYIRHKGIQKIHRKFALEQKRNYEEQERREAERTHELDSQKIKFLTNLSHEFRTPISLILGPVDSLIEKENNIQSFRQLDMIKRNGRRLLNLVNQLLDFRKMEEHELKLHMAEGEVVSFVKEVADSFKDLAERKTMDFVYTSQIDKLYAYFDHDKMERVLFNVLSNAFKFTRPCGKIMLDIKKVANIKDESKTWVALKISDTGIGIPDDKKEKIFSLFYQNDTDASILNQGSGIGLTITKEFVKMQGGTITLESAPELGTVFNILLPFTNCPAPANNMDTVEAMMVAETRNKTFEPPQAPHEFLQDQTEMPAVLLVEDNDDFRYYLKDKLQLRYKVYEAINGIDGWKKALALHPQLIVSDISMPEMNGIELCRKLKADKRTNHIPVILLTAVTAEEVQLQGLKTGANDYITKPFHVEMLNEKINNLLVLNTTLKNTYSKQFKPVSPQVEIQSADEDLLQSIMVYLEENLSNPQLSVTELSKHAGMSRSSLYAKLLELTGQTPVEYIRSVKLDKAAVLLQKSDMNVAQIAYSVGFSTPNYFAKSFKAKFNLLPSEYISKLRQEGKKNGTV
ncbi:MAG: two-component regulator propeller domain-containing protein [Chitinophagaceae bacterium]